MASPLTTTIGLAAGAALLAVILAAAGGAGYPALDTDYFDAPRPMVIAHQGGDWLRPGNTLPAFEHAVALGVDVLEMDVHRTRDGALVLIHDDTVDRTTDGSGAVRDLTLAELRALDAAYHWPLQGDARPFRGLGIRIPTLEEVVERYPELRYNIELKPPDPDVATALCAALGRLEIRRRVLVASFHPAAMDGFRAACPGVPTSGHPGEARRFYLLYRTGLWRVFGPGTPALQLPPVYDRLNLSTPGFLEAAARRNVHVDIWTVNDLPLMTRLMSDGVGGIITDRPDLMLEARREVAGF